MATMVRIVASFGALVALAGCGAYLPAHTLHQAAKREVYTTATCADVEVSHVPTTDVASRREDVYMAEGCGMRWRMTCESGYVKICPRHARSDRACHQDLQFSCSNIQSDADERDDDLRARVTRPDDMNIVGS